MVILSLALNLYWMSLMIKMARRSAARMSGEAGSQAKKTVEKVELINQNQLKSDAMPQWCHQSTTGRPIDHENGKWAFCPERKRIVW